MQWRSRAVCFRGLGCVILESASDADLGGMVRAGAWLDLDLRRKAIIPGNKKTFL